MNAMTRLLSEASQRDTTALFVVMLMARLTEGIGLFLLIPLLDNISGTSAASGLSKQISLLLVALGIPVTIGPLLLLFVGLVALRGLLQFVQQQLAARYQYVVIDKLRRQLFGQLLRAEWRWLADKRASDLATLLTVGVGRIGVGLNQLIGLIAGITTLVAFGATALILSWPVTLIALVAGLIAYALFSGTRTRAVALGHTLNDANRGFQASVQDGLATIRLTKLAHAEARHQEAFAEVIGDQRQQQLRFLSNSGLSDMALQIGGAAMLAVLLYGGLTWLNLPIAVLFTIVLIFARLLPAFASTQQSWHYWLHSRAALEEYDQALADSAKAAEPVLAGEPMPLRNALVVSNLSFAYADRSKPVLENISFDIPANTTTALSGPSGSGKSTLADLLCGLLQPDSGHLSIDGVVLDSTSRLRWRRSIAYVQQDSFLFHDSIIANLRWAHPDASMEDIRAALHAAAADFVFALPDGLYTIVGDAGQKLSGGERQRIALARALLAKPELLILDEATSALDLVSEQLVHTALAKLRGKMTIIIIGHRLSGLKLADQHIRFENGTLIIETMDRAIA
jgi:ATP-binding cassette, subfamily C, bacterial